MAARESITVVDGATNTIIGTIAYPPLHNPRVMEVDPAMNLLYATVSFSGRETLFLVDTNTDTITGSMFSAGSRDTAIDQTTHRVYLTNACNVSVVFGKELLRNSSFEGVGQTGQPRFWRERGLAPEDGVEEIDCLTSDDFVYEGDLSLRLTGTVGVEKEVFQNVDAAGDAGTVLNLEGVSRATGASPTGGHYEIKARVFFTDESTDTFAVHFRRITHSWRREIETYTAPKPFDRVRVSVVYENQTGTAWFDAVHLWTTP